GRKSVARAVRPRSVGLLRWSRVHPRRSQPYESTRLALQMEGGIVLHHELRNCENFSQLAQTAKSRRPSPKARAAASLGGRPVGVRPPQRSISLPDLGEQIAHHLETYQPAS